MAERCLSRMIHAATTTIPDNNTATTEIRLCLAFTRWNLFDYELFEKRKETLEFGLVRLRAVLAKLEGFGVFHLLRLVRRIPLAKFCPEAIGDALAALVESGSDRGAACFLFFSITP